MDRKVQDGEAKEFTALVVLALREGVDAYGAGRYLDDIYGWPVDHHLIKILEGAYHRARFLTRDFVARWVMRHSVRFPAKKGSGVRARIGDVEISGEVIEVIGVEARAIVRCGSRRHKGKNISINAEEVLATFEMTSPKSPNGGPTGGTPVARAVNG